MTELIIIGGGLAGSEAAWQAAQQGLAVKLYEMRPIVSTGAHITGLLAELVCSNSLGSILINHASGLLIEELRRLGSMVLDCAEATALPAGGALAVDRGRFSTLVTQRIQGHPLIQLIREEMTNIPDTPCLIASGPLTSPDLSQAILQFTGQDHLFFFDAIAPIVTVDSIDMGIAFRGSRYGKGLEADGDYINCPFNRSEYDAFVEALSNAERIELKEFEAELNLGVQADSGLFFEGCLPVEILARRSPRALAFGPMRPIGLKDPRVGKGAYALVQLRQDNLSGSLYNLVGFQTNLKFSEQKRVFRMIPGLQQAEFIRYGQMHRNTFLASPLLLEPTLQARQRPDLFFAGQITGVEGYLGNIATGLLAGSNAARFIQGKKLMDFPQTTMLGALCYYITHTPLNHFQPMKANFGILPQFDEQVKGKLNRAAEYVRRSLQDFDLYIQSVHNQAA